MTVRKQASERKGLELPEWLRRAGDRRQVRTRAGVSAPETPWEWRKILHATTPPLPNLGELRVVGKRWPARGSTLSGDLWWVVSEAPVCRLLIIDTMGHGDLCAYFACMLYGALLERSQYGGPHPGAVGSLVWIQEIIRNMTPPDNQEYLLLNGAVVQACAGAIEIDVMTGNVEMAGRGIAGFFRSTPNAVDFYELAGQIITPQLDGKDVPLVQHTEMARGDRLWIMTDGLLEARNVEERPFAGCLRGVLRDAHVLAPDSAVEHVHDLAVRHTSKPDGLEDDATLIVADFLGSGACRGGGS